VRKGELDVSLEAEALEVIIINAAPPVPQDGDQNMVETGERLQVPSINGGCPRRSRLRSCHGKAAALAMLAAALACDGEGQIDAPVWSSGSRAATNGTTLTSSRGASAASARHE
jgi:hypothetical protein